MDVSNNSFLRVMALVCAISSTVLSLLQIREHLRHNPLHSMRVFVNRILLMVPIYAWTSYCSLSFGGAIYWDTARDCYEAFVIYSFFQFLVACLGGEQRIIANLQRKPQRNHIFPFNCLRSWKMGEQFFYRVEWGTLQYAGVKPFAALLGVLLGLLGVYKEGSLSLASGYFWVTGINNLSQIWAMYCLILFYMTHKDALLPIRPVPKFLCIKGLIFFTFWQSMLVQFLVFAGTLNGTNEQALQLDDLIICFEMLIFALAHRFAFPPSDFWSGPDFTSANVTDPMFRSLLSAADVSDVFGDLRQNLPFQKSAGPEMTDMQSTSARVFVARDPSRPVRAPAAEHSPHKLDSASESDSESNRMSSSASI